MYADPFKESRLQLGSLRARQARLVQEQRLKAMNREMRNLKKDFWSRTRYQKPSEEDILDTYREKRYKEETRAQQYSPYIKDKKKHPTNKAIAELVLSNYANGNYNVIDKDIPITYRVHGYYL